MQSGGCEGQRGLRYRRADGHLERLRRRGELQDVRVQRNGSARVLQLHGDPVRRGRVDVRKLLHGDRLSARRDVLLSAERRRQRANM